MQNIDCWVISDSNRLSSLRAEIPFYDYDPSCYFRITQRIDNAYILGNLGHRTMQGRFHDNINQSYDYFVEFNKRNSVYFSFDQINLYKLVEILQTKPLTFTLKRIENPQRIIKNKAFMIMPFGYTALNKFYIDHIKSFLKNDLSIDIWRSDDFVGNDIIVDTIYNQIEESEFVIVDTSHSNKNVFFEFGYAAALKKEIITIQNSNVDGNIFFDQAHIRAIFYSTRQTRPFKLQLKNTITAIRQKNNAFN